MERQRGQVLPLWAMGTITTLVLTFLALNYANAVRYQIRAQNAADSAAQAVVAIQAERWNLMTEMLYASNIEEYRMRRLLDGMLLSINYSGGCSSTTQDFSNLNNPNNELSGSVPPPYMTNNFFGNMEHEGTCNRTYVDLHDNFLRASNRYTQDIGFLNDVTALSTYTNWSKDAKSLLGTLATDCNNTGATGNTLHSDGGDCAFKYTMLGAAERTGLLSVDEDAQEILVPSLGHTSNIGNDSENPELFAPVKVDIVTCRIVPPIIPSFGPFHLSSTYAIGRAAATNVQMEQDWFVPGSLIDPARSPGGSSTGSAFQPPESYTQSSGADTGAGNTAYDWYDVDYGGNATTAYPSYGVFYAPIINDEMSARFGWWNAIPITPFAGSVQTSNVC